MKRTTVLSLLVVLASTSAAASDELIEKTVVRNRLHALAGKMELGASVGLTLLSRLTDHTNVNLRFAYNLSDNWAVEGRAGYALGPMSHMLDRHTGLADQIAEHFAANTGITTADDLADLWEIHGNGAVGARWSPMYGKISLMAEIPVHFQAYLWLGAGVAQFHRESIVYCTNGSGSTCNAYLTNDKIGPFASAAVGFRFFVTTKHSVALEIRDYTYPDSYLIEINRADARAGRDTGTLNPAASVTNLVLLDVGYTYTF